MYKKVVILSLLFASVFFFLDKLLDKSKPTIPDPETHIREVFGYLKENDEDKYSDLILPMEYMEKMGPNQLIEMFSGMNGMEFSMAMALIIQDTLWQNKDVFKREYHRPYDDGFEETHEDVDGWKSARIDRITWKLVGSSEFSDIFRCNAKIYIRTDEGYYCVKYKDIFFYQGRWYVGHFTEVDEIDEEGYDFFPDMYQGPAVEEYIDGYDDGYPDEEVPELPVESVEEEAASESPSESRQED